MAAESPTTDASDRPHEAQPVATSVTIPAPKVRWRLPADARNLIFLRTSSIFNPNKTADISKRSTSLSEIA